MSNQITPNPSVPSQVVAEVKFPNFINNLGIIPTSYKDSMSYYECLAWLCKFLEEQVIPTVNENGEAVEELQALYVELNSYVTNYFDTLDVQEEINNKLDDMVEAGTLQEIIADYLNSKAVFGFDSIQDLKDSTNLINGSYAETFGYYSSNDGGNSLYKIRTKTENDVEDLGSIIFIGDSLVAELVDKNNVNVKQFGAYGDETHDDSSSIQNALDVGTKIVFNNGTYLISETLYIKSNTEIIGEEKAYITAHSTTIGFSNYRDQKVENITFKNLNFIGNCVNDPDISHYPKRDRDFKNLAYEDGLSSAIILIGKNYKRQDITYECNNVKIINCNFNDTYGLPINLLGIINVTFENNHVVNCMDSGFVDCENVLITNNIIEKSADNGLSISSGCNIVNCSDNIINYSAIAGIWCSGWKVDGIMYYGPKNVIISNNIIRHSRTGILAKWVVENIKIENNQIDYCYFNYKGQTTDSTDGGAGINVQGWSGTTIYEGQTISVTAISKNISINNNMVSNCQRDGVYTERIEDVSISNNIFTNVGNKTHQDGTSILTTETKYNNLIYMNNYDVTLNSKIFINKNIYKDTREDYDTYDYLNYKYVASQTLNITFEKNIFFMYDDAKIYVYGTNIKDSLRINDLLTYKKDTSFINLPDTITTVQGLYDYFHSDELYELTYQNAYFVKLSNTLLGNLIGFSGSSGFGCIYRFNNNIVMFTVFLPTSGLIYTGRINQGSVDTVHKYTGIVPT